MAPPRGDLAEPVQLGGDPGLEQVEHLLEVFALQVCGVAQVAEAQPQIVQMADVVCAAFVRII